MPVIFKGVLMSSERGDRINNAPSGAPDTGLCNALNSVGQAARKAARVLGAASPAQKKTALLCLADLLLEHQEDLLATNAKDMEAATALDEPKRNRLCLTPQIITDMAEACRYVADLPDPVGAMTTQWQRPNGILVGRMRVPLGVIAMIYESRPNVTVDASILCLKAGNAVILRGGSEAFHSNTALAALIHQALEQADLPGDAVQVLASTDRALVAALCKLDAYVDVLIPRGGEHLVRFVTEQATMPVLKHFQGITHAFIDASAHLENAVNIVYNAKVQRPGVCNALECLLVHASIAPFFLPLLAERLPEVELRADARALPLLDHAPARRAALVAQQPTDLGQEFHDLILAVCVVDSLDEALDHIARYTSHHTEIICTNNYENAQRFLREADASMVGVNVSTRFNDGSELGLGAEIGISTSKLHAYGPMGVEELTTTKFVVVGQGQVRDS